MPSPALIADAPKGIEKPGSRRRWVRLQVAILIAAAAIRIAWALILPPLGGSDEAQHFLYAQQVRQRATLDVKLDTSVPPDLERLARTVLRYPPPQHPGPRFGFKKTRPKIGGAQSPAPLDILLSGPRALARPVIGHPGFNHYHPPLYYTAVAAVTLPLADEPIRTRLLAGRAISIAAGVASVWAALVLGGLLWPGRPALAASLGVLVGFQPAFVHYTSVVSNEPLNAALFSWGLVVLTRVMLTGVSRRRLIALALLFAAGLATKVSFLAFLPLIPLAWIWRGRPSSRQINAQALAWREGAMVLCTVALLILVGWWYTKTLLHGGSNLVALFDQGGAARPIGPLGFLRENDWFGDYGRVIFRYWGARLDTLPNRPPTLPFWMLTALSVLSLFSILATATALIRRRLWQGVRPGNDPLPSPRVMVMLAAATLTTAAFYSYADYRLTRDLGGHFGIRGQYFLPPLLGQMAWLLTAVLCITPRRWGDPMASLLALGMVMLTTFTLLGVILPRAYGWAGAPTLAQRIGTIQGVPPWIAALGLLVACLAPIVAGIALLSHARVPVAVLADSCS